MAAAYLQLSALMVPSPRPLHNNFISMVLGAAQDDDEADRYPGRFPKTTSCISCDSMCTNSTQASDPPVELWTGCSQRNELLGTSSIDCNELCAEICEIHSIPQAIPTEHNSQNAAFSRLESHEWSGHQRNGLKMRQKDYERADLARTEHRGLVSLSCCHSRGGDGSENSHIDGQELLCANERRQVEDESRLCSHRRSLFISEKLQDTRMRSRESEGLNLASEERCRNAAEDCESDQQIRSESSYPSANFATHVAIGDLLTDMGRNPEQPAEKRLERDERTSGSNARDSRRCHHGGSAQSLQMRDDVDMTSLQYKSLPRQYRQSTPVAESPELLCRGKVTPHSISMGEEKLYQVHSSPSYTGIRQQLRKRGTDKDNASPSDSVCARHWSSHDDAQFISECRPSKIESVSAGRALLACSAEIVEVDELKYGPSHQRPFTFAACEHCEQPSCLVAKTWSGEKQRLAKIRGGAAQADQVIDGAVDGDNSRQQQRLYDRSGDSVEDEDSSRHACKKIVQVQVIFLHLLLMLFLSIRGWIIFPSQVLTSLIQDLDGQVNFPPSSA